MNIDRLARQTHRRGFLAALVALAVPATARTAGAQFARCSPRGAACTLTIDCCGSVKCYRDLLNPNSGICGGVRIEDDGPSFILPSSGGGSSDQGGGGARLTNEQLIARYDRNRDGTVNCDDFATRAEAQAAYNADPSDPFGLDGPPGTSRQGAGVYGVPCEHLPE